MSFAPPAKERRILFVARHFSGENLRSARAISALENVSLFGACEQSPDDQSDQTFSAIVRLAAVHNPEQLITAAQDLAKEHGDLERIVTTTETLLEPVAYANEALGLEGTSVATVRRALDKSSLKEALERAGIDTARDRLLTSEDDARSFVEEVGFPIVLKPLRGSGGLATWRLRDDAQLETALELMQPSLSNPILAEEYILGQELCIDTIAIAGEPRFYSICCYRPSILAALEDPCIQWSCVMPRDIDSEVYREFIEQGLTAVRVLEVGSAITHLEGFLSAKGGVRFTDATLRPAGARIGAMLAFAYDMDPYLAWARAAVDSCFDGPWERKYAVGTVFLRGMGQGRVLQVEGIEAIKRELGPLLVDGRLPQAGIAKSATYTGDGFVSVRHSTTSAVEAALEFVARTVRITYSDPEPPRTPHSSKEQLSERLRYFDKQLNKPVWDGDSLAVISHAR